MTEESTILQPKRPWAALAIWAAIFAGIAMTFAAGLGRLWTSWFPAWKRLDLGLYSRLVEGDSYYTHGPLVPLVSVAIIYLLVRHTRIPVKPSRKLGLILVGLCLVVHVMGVFVAAKFVAGYALVGILLGLVLTFWGFTALKRMWFPLALLVCMIPFPQLTISEMNFRMKEIAAQGGVTLANLMGILAERSGNVVLLEDDKRLVVASVCSGLRTMISLLTFAALYAYVCQLRGVWRILLFAAAVPVAIASNVLRIFALILVAHVWDVPTATGKFHDISGILIFVFAFLIMFGLEKLVLLITRMKPDNLLERFGDVRRGSEDAGQWARMVQAPASATGVLVCVLLAGSVACSIYLERPAKYGLTSVGLPWEKVPEQLAVQNEPLSATDQKLEESVLTFLRTNEYIYRKYQGLHTSLDFLVLFSQNNRESIHRPELCLEGSGQEIVRKQIVTVKDVPGRKDFTCEEIVVQSGPQKGYYLYTYWSAAGYTADYWKQQRTIWINSLLRRNTGGALVRVSMPLNGDLDDARSKSMEFLRAAVPYLDRALPQ